MLYEIRYTTASGFEGSQMSAGENWHEAIKNFLEGWAEYGDELPISYFAVGCMVVV